MYLDFDKLFLSSEVVVDSNHEWGYELRLVQTELYCSKILVLLHRIASSTHRHVCVMRSDSFTQTTNHPAKDETFTVLRGRCDLGIEEHGGWTVHTLGAGNSYRVPPEAYHSFIALETPTYILETSTPHFDEGVERKAA